MIIDTDNYFDVAEACKVLGIKKARMSQLCNSDRFEGSVHIGHFWLIPKDAVEKYVPRTRCKKARD